MLRNLHLILPVFPKEHSLERDSPNCSQGPLIQVGLRTPGSNKSKQDSPWQGGERECCISQIFCRGFLGPFSDLIRQQRATGKF